MKKLTILAILVAVAFTTTVFSGCDQTGIDGSVGVTDESGDSDSELAAVGSGDKHVLKAWGVNLYNPDLPSGKMIIARDRVCATSGVTQGMVIDGIAEQQQLEDSSNPYYPTPAWGGGKMSNSKSTWTWEDPTDGVYLVQVYTAQLGQLFVQYDGVNICPEEYYMSNDELVAVNYRAWILTVKGDEVTCVASGLSPYATYEKQQLYITAFVPKHGQSVWCDNPADGNCLANKCGH